MAIITTWGFNTIPIHASTLEETSWDTISTISRLGLAKKYFNIGDEKTIYVDNVPYIAHIIGFDHDTIIESEQTKYGRSTAGITFQLKDVLSNDYEQGDTASSAWKNKPLKQTVDNLINIIDEDLQYKIPTVYKYCRPRLIKNDQGEINIYGSLDNIEKVEHKLFLLSVSEVFTISSETSNYYGEGNQYQYFLDGNSKNKKDVKENNNNASWWLRTIGIYEFKPTMTTSEFLSRGTLVNAYGTNYLVNTEDDVAHLKYAVSDISFAFCI